MNKEKLLKVFKKEDGAGLVLALMVLMVLAVLGVTVAGVTIGSHKLGHINRDSNSAYYIAEAGANLAYEDIKSNVKDIYEKSSKEDIYFGYINDLIEPFKSEKSGKIYYFDEQFGEQPLAIVEIIDLADNGDGKHYTIVSTGEINGITRTVEKPFTVSWVDKIGGIGLPKLPDGCALYVGRIDLFLKEFPFLSSYARVEGDILTRSNYNSSEKNYHISKIRHFKAGGTGTNNIDYLDNLDMQPYYDLEGAFPEFPDTTGYKNHGDINSRNVRKISENSRITTLTVGTASGLFSYPLTIDTGTGTQERTVNIVVNNLHVYNDIEITGTGTVNIYVIDKMEIKTIYSGIKVGSNNVKQLNILYSGTRAVEFLKYSILFGNNISFTGSIFSKNADLLFYNNVKLEGIIIAFGESKTMTMAESVEVTASIYAPKSSVNILLNSKVKGTLVAEKVTFYGSITGRNNEVQYYLNDYLQTYPYGTGTGEIPTLDKLIFSQAAIEP